VFDCGICDDNFANDNVTCTDLCDVIWGENDCLDECGVPDGDDSSCADCHGDPNGTAEIDNCGTCVGGNSGNVACVQDCAYNWGGSATFQLFYIDNDGDGLGIGTASSLCNGLDTSGWVTNNVDPDDDCPSNVIDECFKCDGTNACWDCNNVPFGAAALDKCNICVGGNTGNTACIPDCANVWGGSATVDDCGVCDDNIANDNVTCMDACDVLYGGCEADGTGCTPNESCADACGMPKGGCEADGTGCTPNESCADCNGVPNGDAKIDPHYNEDSCTVNECVSGNTGNVACEQDCAYKWGGDAEYKFFWIDSDLDGEGIGTKSESIQKNLYSASPPHL
jgi:hypothetical protein